MLSRDDQQQLIDIERRLSCADPAFAARMGAPAPVPTSAFVFTTVAWLIVLAVVALDSPMAAAAITTALILAVVTVRRRRRRAVTDRPPG